MIMVKSFDKKSHYPATALMRKFPLCFNVVKGNLAIKLKKWHKENIDFIGLDNPLKFIDNMLSINGYFQPNMHYFLTRCTLSNITINVNNSFCNMPLIPLSKTTISDYDLLDKNLIVDNGKILKADKLTIYCTSIDLLSYEMFYTFDITACERLEYTNKAEWADIYIQETFRYHLTKKDIISKIIKGNVNINNAIVNNTPLYDEILLSKYNDFSETEKMDFLDNEYTSVKQNGVNNQYGINVQKCVNNEIFFDLSSFEFKVNENELQGVSRGRTTRDFITGLFITAYARLDLALITFMFFIMSELTPVYWDTDSVKILCKTKQEEKKALEIIEYYNNKFSKLQKYVISLFGEIYEIGIFENDYNYDYFFTLGAKKYLVAVGEEIHLTNSGLNKKTMSETLTSEYKKLLAHYDSKIAFEKLINNFYHPNMIIGSDKSGRNTVTFPNIHENFIDTYMPDDNGDLQHINQYECANITECDYLLHAIDIKHLANKEYYMLSKKLHELYNIPFNINIKNQSFGSLCGNTSDDKNDFILKGGD